MNITKDLLETTHENIREVIRLTADKIDSESIIDNVPKKGDQMPSFQLKNTEGNIISSKELLEEGPLILIFSPGNLTLNSNLELQSYQESLPEIHKLGANLVIISQDSRENIEKVIEDNLLEYEILIDENNEMARKIGLVTHLDKKLSDVYKKLGIRLLRDKDNLLELPIPATFVVDTDSSIILSYIDMDYTNRLSPEEALDGLRNRR
ncbi:redoxin domain-containing protein [Clostridium sp. D2Q-11]|uniref:thioredoxin-dependent peroxiredoxin n=1 Tax=Anaeromonas frigoriresistens TaxID=2683708 RepID=A0A942Z7H2_9FIRM|nr:redoxin domain-containing protein [Anaeromonas frigoriresistens]MBS4536960.1 redoxin domain-containing protein [Anaeromonas frigoriresistens]